MARRKAKADEPERKAGLKAFELDDARPLITIGPDHTAWTGGTDGQNPAGAIVRLQPPADATDARIEEIKAMFELSGAVAVKVLPRASIGAVGSVELGGGTGQSPATPIGLREAVHATAGRMASADHDALRAELDSAMDEGGL